MARDTCVYMVADRRHRLTLGLTKSVDFEMWRLRRARPQDHLRLVYQVWFPTIREALAHLNELEGLSVRTRRKRVERGNPSWIDFSPEPVVAGSAEVRDRFSEELGSLWSDFVDPLDDDPPANGGVAVAVPRGPGPRAPGNRQELPFEPEEE
jgi:hypothetical protein